MPQVPTPRAPIIPKTLAQKDSIPRVIVVLEQACLETAKVGKSNSGNYALLNSDDHKNILRKNNREISEVRPDITHQCLMTLLDSPLNKAGRLQVYIHTTKNVLIEVNPQIRIPRTFQRFCGLMVQLLHKLSIRAAEGPEKLLKVVKNPITDHFPTKCRKIACSGDVPTMRIQDYVATLPQNESVAFFIGAMAHGKDDFADEIVDDKVSISEYPLSASVVCGKVCNAFEDVWNIV